MSHHTIADLIFAAMPENFAAELVNKACLAMSRSGRPELEVQVFGSGSETASPPSEQEEMENPTEPADPKSTRRRKTQATASEPKTLEMDEKISKQLEKRKKDKQRKNRPEKK